MVTVVTIRAGDRPFEKLSKSSMLRSGASRPAPRVLSAIHFQFAPA
jgi:hypothetical protein